MDLLVCFELEKEGVKGPEVLERGRVDIEDWGEGQSKKEIVDSSAGELSGFEIRHAIDICSREMHSIEPVNTALEAIGTPFRLVSIQSIFFIEADITHAFLKYPRVEIRFAAMS